LFGFIVAILLQAFLFKEFKTIKVIGTFPAKKKQNMRKITNLFTFIDHSFF
jgi:hypothetical protein